MLAQLFAVIAPVFFTAAVGFAWVKSGRPFDIRQLTPLITQVGSPCLVLSTLLKAEIAPGALVQMAGASALAHGGNGMLSLRRRSAMLRVTRAHKRKRAGAGVRVSASFS